MFLIALPLSLPCVYVPMVTGSVSPETRSELSTWGVGQYFILPFYIKEVI
jgi:hypothetical protein